MKLRKQYAVPDRIKLLLMLVFVLIIMLAIAWYGDKQTTQQEKRSTIEDFLKTALEPVGTTMYIWGGGWDDADSQAGTGSTRIGLSPEWKAFMDEQDETYDFEDYRFQREKGLDCSGYIGWVVYNIFEKEDGLEGYVTSSTDMAENFASRGWGKLLENPTTFLPGDIVSMDGHVWLSLGTCEDGSVLLVHSSPPGVSVCGTPVLEMEQENTEGAREEQDSRSIAVQLAEDFMSTYYPKWQERYPNRSVGLSYLNNVKVMRWSSKTMSDAEEFQGMSGEEVLDLLGN